MAHNERHMIPAKVKSMGNTFDTFGNILSAVATALQIALRALQAASFISMGTTLAAERFVSYWEPRIKEAGKMCKELAQDAIQSANDWERANKVG